MTRRAGLWLVLAVLAAAAVPAGAAPVRVMGSWSGPEEDHFRAVLAAFVAGTGIAVEYQREPALLEALQTRAVLGDPPHLAVLPRAGLVRELAAGGSLAPLGPVLNMSYLQRAYHPRWLEAGNVRGRLYALPLRATHGSLVWYRPELFARYGMDPRAIASWTDWLAAAGAFRAAGLAPLSVAGASPAALAGWLENLLVRVAGPAAHERLTTGELPWTAPEVAAAFTLLGQVVDPAGGLVAGGASAAAALGPVEAALAPFHTPPRAAMFPGNDRVALLLLAEGLEPAADFAAFRFPDVFRAHAPGATVAGGEVVVLFAGRESEEAAALLEFLASPEAAETWARRGPYFSPNSLVDLEVYTDPVTRQVAADLRRHSFVFSAFERFSVDFADAVLGRGLGNFLRAPESFGGLLAQLEREAATRLP